MIYIQYVFLVTAVVFLSVNLSKYVDELDNLTDLSGAFIGGILLAGITSLPEFITSTTAVLFLDEPNLVQGNVLGSNIFNCTVLGACFLLASKKFTNGRIEKNHIYTTFITLILCFFFSYFIKSPLELGSETFNLNIISLVFILGYVMNLFVVGKDHGSIGNSNVTSFSQPTNQSETSSNTIKTVILKLIIFAILLVIASVYLTNVSNQLNEKLQIGATIGGAIFLGIATSLPELTASINLIRLNNFNAAVGNVVGSNMFNLIILSFADIIYHKSSLYTSNPEALNLLNFGILALLMILSAFFTKGKTFLTKIFGVIIVGCYVMSIIMSI